MDIVMEMVSVPTERSEKKKKEEKVNRKGGEIVSIQLYNKRL